MSASFHVAMQQQRQDIENPFSTTMTTTTATHTQHLSICMLCSNDEEITTIIPVHAQTTTTTTTELTKNFRLIIANEYGMAG